MFDAYLEPWALAAEVIGADGFRTGDQGWFDQDGDLHLAGRRDNRISMAGMKFFCEEVEAVLDAHPGVRQSRVAARAHAHLGEVPVASIVPADAAQPPTQDALLEHCRRHLPAHKIPREVTIVAQLPLTVTGKLRRG
jgi:acyl-CoA synthetase (AMP-forming)/AMP-acid ligase II